MDSKHLTTEQILMGADIHVFVEKFDEETKTWFMIKGDIDGAEGRNYELFGALANVRTWDDDPNREPKGLPEDVSLGVLDESNRWGVDGHSHSWDTLTRFLELLKKYTYGFEDAKIADLRVRQNNLSKEETTTLSKYNKFDYYAAEWACEWDSNVNEHVLTNPEQYRVCYWFDN